MGLNAEVSQVRHDSGGGHPAPLLSIVHVLVATPNTLCTSPLVSSYLYDASDTWKTFISDANVNVPRGRLGCGLWRVGTRCVFYVIYMLFEKK